MKRQIVLTEKELMIIKDSLDLYYTSILNLPVVSESMIDAVYTIRSRIGVEMALLRRKAEIEEKGGDE